MFMVTSIQVLLLACLCTIRHNGVHAKSVMLDVKDNKVLISFDSVREDQAGGEKTGTEHNTLPYKADLFDEPFNIEDPLTGAASVVQHPGLSGTGLAGLLQLTTPASGTAFAAAPTAVDAAPIVAAVADAAAATGSNGGSNSTESAAARGKGKVKAKVCKAGSRRPLANQPQRYLWCVSGRELEMQCSIGTSFCADQQTCCKFDDAAYAKAQQDYVQEAEEEQEAASSSGDGATTVSFPPPSVPSNAASPILPPVGVANDVIATSSLAVPNPVVGGQQEAGVVPQQPLLQQQLQSGVGAAFFPGSNQQMLTAPNVNIASSLPGATLDGARIAATAPATNPQVSLTGVSSDAGLLAPNNLPVASPPVAGAGGILQPTLLQQQPLVPPASALNAVLSPHLPLDGPVLRELPSALPAAADAKTLPLGNAASLSTGTGSLPLPPSPQPPVVQQQQPASASAAGPITVNAGQRTKVNLPDNNSYTIHIALNQDTPKTPYVAAT